MLIDRNKININDISTDFLNSTYIENHSNMWDCMSKKYEFMDKSIDFKESVYLTKEIINNQIKEIDRAKTLKIKLR